MASVGFSPGLAIASLFLDQPFSFSLYDSRTTLVLSLGLSSSPAFEIHLTTFSCSVFPFPVCIDWPQMLSGAPPSPLVVLVDSCLSFAHDFHYHVLATVKAPTFS